MSQSTQPEFGKIRSHLWPIHSYELKKFLPMVLIFFFLSLNYNILRNMKDVLVVTAPNSGAEIIPFIKAWVMFPMAIGMTWLFAFLSSKLSKEKTFYVIISGFLGFFALFAFILYPNNELLHPHATADKLQLILPEGLKGFVAMFRYWTFCCFYAMSELWGNMTLFLLFWGFANEITKVSEAKRFYGLLGIGANVAGIAAGQTSIFCSRHVHKLNIPYMSSSWDQTLLVLVCIILASGGIALFLYRWMHTQVLTDPRFYCPEKALKRKKTKPKFSIRESLSYIANSPYLRNIAVIVLGYNLIINLVEVVWKHEVRNLYPNPSDYNIYMNQVTTFIGVLATVTALLVSGNSIRKFGWTTTALITPAILGVTSVCFFSFILFEESLGSITYMLFGTSPLVMIVFFGSAQNVLSRGAKYTVYDATKELAYIPLGDECKMKGKAIIDGVGTRMGKSAGSVVHQSLLIIFSSLSASAPYIALILFALLGVWVYSTLSLGKQFAQLTAEQQEKENEPPPSKEPQQQAV